LLIPEATPEWLEDTAAITVLVRGATLMVMPTANTSRPGRRPVQKPLPIHGPASKAKPIPAMIGPTVSMARAPTLPAIRPATPDRVPITADSGSSVAPASAAL
jgi:hypothetical protein